MFNIVFQYICNVSFNSLFSCVRACTFAKGKYPNSQVSIIIRYMLGPSGGRNSLVRLNDDKEANKSVVCASESIITNHLATTTPHSNKRVK